MVERRAVGKGGVGGVDPSVPGSERPQRLVGLLFTLLSAPPATSTSPLLYSLPPLSSSRLHLSLLCFTLHSVRPPPPPLHSAIITPAPQPPLFHLHSQLITSSYFSYSHFFLSLSLHQTFVRALHYLLGRGEKGWVTGGALLDKQSGLLKADFCLM